MSEVSHTADWDDDIAALALTDVEKNGLQVYRNYTAAFEKEQVRRFCAEVDAIKYDVSRLEKVAEAIVTDEERLVPVIACAFVDEILDEMFKREILEGVPGGREGLFHGFGPLTNLAQRIQIAFSFGWISADVLKDVDAVRKVRNKLSHAWDHASFRSFVSSPPVSEITPVEGFFTEHEERLQLSGVDGLDDSGRFRIRLLWVAGRTYYEGLLYVHALKRKLDPVRALYGAQRPNLLSSIAEVCSRYSRRVLGREI